MKDYFEILEMPLSFRPDLSELKNNYYRLIKAYHPDHYTIADENIQEEALFMSGEVNTAYKVLSDEQSRLSYLLHFLEVLKDGEHEVMSEEFLMEIMDINEAIFDLEMDFDDNKKKITLLEIEDKKKEYNDELNRGIDMFENQTDRVSSLNIIKENFLKMKYMLRIQKNISTFASL